MAEIAGLVLGAIPLLIAAAENYEVVFQPFVTMHRHLKEAQRFTARLDAQRAIFQNECQLLLLSVGQNLTDILGDPSHPSRNDTQLSERLEQLLGTSYNTCIWTLNLINDTLQEISTETEGIRTLLDQKKSKGKGPMSLFRHKIKLGFSKTRLNEIVDELRRYNSDLGRLSSQIRRLSAKSIQSASSDVSSTVLSHIQITQQASTRLFDALAAKWSCDNQSEHTASMDLTIDQRCQHAQSKVRFNLGVACKQRTIGEASLWLAFESAPNDFLNDSETVANSASLQATLVKMGATRKNVKFALSSSVRTEPMASHINSAAKLYGPQLNLYNIDKLCQFFRNNNLGDGDNPCIGFIDNTKNYKHFVYPSSSNPPKQNESQSLKQLLRADAVGNKEADWMDKLSLARLMALAVLRFHPTPWLAESWSSEDIFFFKPSTSTQTTSPLKSPYVNRELSRNPGTGTSVHPSKGSSASSLAANQQLFSLGVVLIELGYNAPFETVSQTDGLNVGPDSQVRDFLAARRLGESVHKKLNMTYGRLVEKCLNCNFGVATKLSDTELQSAVLVHVVSQLDVCLEQYRSFNSLAPASPLSI